jgi:hypothetical protein
VEKHSSNIETFQPIEPPVSPINIDYQLVGGGTLAVTIHLAPGLDELEYSVSLCFTSTAQFNVVQAKPEVVLPHWATNLNHTKWAFSTAPNTLFNVIKYKGRSSEVEKAAVYLCTSSNIRLFNEYQWITPPVPVKLKSRYVSPS